MTPWLAFAVVVLGALSLDLFVSRRRGATQSLREALAWMAVWVSLAIAFNVAVYFWFGPQRALEFTTSYLVEEALSVDNMFVFFVIFSYFAVPHAYQRRVLFWGILGALVLRGAFIAGGVALLEKFQWLIYVFGAFLVFTGIKLFTQEEARVEPEKNPVVKMFRRWVPLVPEYAGHRFTVKREGRRYATPLLLVLALVEATDVVFALDSIPAVLAITRNPFIVYTSNVFAILGLRSLYFVVAGMIGGFRFLHYGLAVVLIFIGVKMLLSKFYEIPTALSLGVVAGVIAVSLAASMVSKTRP